MSSAAAATVRQIGKKVREYCGFTLPEICSNLRHSGQNRIVCRKSLWKDVNFQSLDVSQVSRIYYLTETFIDRNDKYFKKGKFYGYEIYKGGRSATPGLIPDTYRIDWMLLTKQQSEIIDFFGKKWDNAIEQETIDVTLPPFYRLYLMNRKNITEEECLKPITRRLWYS